MARKRTKKEEKPEPGFDWEKSLATFEVSSLLKAGFGYYVEINNITINSENELTKEFNKFKEMNAGV